MNNGILTQYPEPVAMPYGLLGNPQPSPVINVVDYDAKRYIDAIEALDFQPLEPKVRAAINAFVVGCKADGNWTAIKAACIMAGARTLTGALTPLVGAAPTNFNFVTGDYNRKTGLRGNGTNKYLNSNRNNNADPQNSQHLAIYVSTATTSAGGYPTYVGTGQGGTGSSVIGRFLGNAGMYIRSRNTNIETPSNATGFVGISRAASANFTYRAFSANTTYTRTSEAPFNASLGVFLDGNALGSTTYNDGVMAFYSIGESLDLAKLDARVTTLIQTFATAIL
mgnify:CR=1 FL=1